MWATPGFLDGVHGSECLAAALNSAAADDLLDDIGGREEVLDTLGITKFSAAALAKHANKGVKELE